MNRHDAWSFCNGDGALKGEPIQPQFSTSRRAVLLGVAGGLVSWISGASPAIAQMAIQPGSQPENILVTVFLRGGADGLNIVVPYAEDDYHKARPSLHLFAPNDRSGGGDRCLDLDGFFGLHPALRGFHSLFQEKQLAVVHAVGSADQTRSHFSAMSAMERGQNNSAGIESSGWLARYLSATPERGNSPLRAVAIGPMMPDSLRGAQASAIEKIGDFELAQTSNAFRDALAQAYGPSKDRLQAAGHETLQVLSKIRAIKNSAVRGNNAGYPNSEFGEALRQIAQLIRTDIGLELACVDKGGWDTHVGQGVTSGWLPSQLQDLDDGLSAFMRDLGAETRRVTILVMTEFGRRLYENSGLGTDHGRGSIFFALGGGVNGGKVFGDWPGLSEHDLEEPGDLRVTTDYRALLAEALNKRQGFIGARKIFELPGESKLHLFHST